MPHPLILSTWTFGVPANTAAWPALAAGGKSLDAVETACRYAEEDQNNHTVGRGGWPDSSGRVSLDASIMLSPSQRGGVALIRHTLHAISVARKVMEQTPHVLLVGDEADAFARTQGFPEEELNTPSGLAAWERWRGTHRGHARPIRNVEETRSVNSNNHDTIGVLALDGHGVLAGACSTSGLAFKMPGRVGDSPIVGHGLYVDPDAGAAVLTGHGELVMGICGAFLAVEEMRRGASPLHAAAEVLRRIASTYHLSDHDQVGILTLNPRGQWSGASLREGFRVSICDSERNEHIEPHLTLV